MFWHFRHRLLRVFEADYETKDGKFFRTKTTTKKVVAVFFGGELLFTNATAREVAMVNWKELNAFAKALAVGRGAPPVGLLAGG
jgi:hypothetical protein